MNSKKEIKQVKRDITKRNPQKFEFTYTMGDKSYIVKGSNLEDKIKNAEEIIKFFKINESTILLQKEHDITNTNKKMKYYQFKSKDDNNPYKSFTISYII